MAMPFKIQTGVDFSTWATEARNTGHVFDWDAMKPGSAFVIPRSYWAGRPGYKADSYDPLKYRDRVRNSFLTWQMKDESRSSIMLMMSTIELDKKTNTTKKVLDEDGEPALKVGFNKPEGATVKGNRKIAPAVQKDEVKKS